MSFVEALWAGGCVRDQLLGQTPKDYDVATDARPEQVRELFGRRRTLPIGAAFGVISVMGPKSAGHIEVATFRRDAQYSDGRHPDSVAFSTAEEDARRRDFTINGLFFDPIDQRVIDFVGGLHDLQQGIVRAIGDPRERFGEDKLRMLRAVRFTATFGFALEEDTRTAIREQADDLVIVSAERIAAEMRRMLAHRQRARAVQLLEQTNLLAIVLPESATLEPDESNPFTGGADTPWRRTLQTLSALGTEDFVAALGLLIREMQPIDPAAAAVPHDDGHPLSLQVAQAVSDRWRLANDEREGVARLLRDERVLRSARTVAWPTLQRILITADIQRRLAYTEAIAAVLDGSTADIDYCRERMNQPMEVWNPPPIITGDDLRGAGLKPGPAFKRTLEAIRDAQLENKIASKAEAIQLARSMLSTEGG
jgi:poly(A) polymerase